MESQNPYDGITTYELSIMILGMELEIKRVKLEMQRRFEEELKIVKLEPSAPELMPKPKRVINPNPQQRKTSRLGEMLRGLRG